MTKPNCLVIGGAGFIGSHLIDALLLAGRKVTVLSRRQRPVNTDFSDYEYIQGDFTDLNLLRRLLDAHQEVIHLAYATVPNTSFANPLADLLQNLPPAIQLFSEAASRGCRLIYVSSGGTVYGEASALPISEQHSTNPISPYGVTKLTLEKYANLYSVTHGLQVICVRPANAYGERQPPFSGQGFISSAMGSIIKGNNVKIFGKSGTIRDYLYVRDIADGIVAILMHGRMGETYNMGSGIGRSNLDVLEAIKPLMLDIRYQTNVEHLPERIFDVANNILDSSKLTKDTDWLPKTDFQQGLLITRDWLKKQIA